ncbi:MAG: GNAT family N-acetyltransferase [Actinomycetota bacterium]|nr:GNAT family N-acetyltransferase [Actinomycetota bacterium]
MTPFDYTGPIRTERVLMRLLTEADVDAVYSYQSREDVCRYLLFEPRDRDTVAAKVREYSTHVRLEKDGDYLQLAVERVADGRVVGDMYITVKSTENQIIELGWTFHPDAQGQGYASECAAALVRFSFEQLGAHRVMAELDPRNHGSIGLCERLGMTKEAHFREDLWFKGEWADTGVYAILDREWRGLES